MNRRKVPNVNRILIAITVVVSLIVIAVHAQQAISLCELQKTAVDGNHQAVRVSGLLEGGGLEESVLTDSSCPNENGTWVELHLKSQRNLNKLQHLLTRSRKANVVLVGEFYGSQKPDEKLPPAIKENYRPGWGHLGAFRTKIVVAEIESVSPVNSPKVDEVTAISIAEKALAKIYGKDKINSEKPFRAGLSNGVWHVGGTLHCKDMNGNDTTVCVGGVAMADVRESDGKVLRTGHTK